MYAHERSHNHEIEPPVERKGNTARRYVSLFREGKPMLVSMNYYLIIKVLVSLKGFVHVSHSALPKIGTPA